MTSDTNIFVSEPQADTAEILSPAARGIFWGIFYVFGAPFIIFLSLACPVSLIDDHSFGNALFLAYPFSIIAMFVATIFMRANRMKRRYAFAQITILMVWIPFIAIFVGAYMQFLSHGLDDNYAPFWEQSALVLPVTLLAGIIPVAEFKCRRAKFAPLPNSWDQPEYLTAIWVVLAAVLVGSALLFYAANHS